MKNTCLFALDLCPTVTSQMLRDVFRQFGNLVEDETMIRQGKGLGLIRFQTRTSAENARRAMNGVILGHYPLNIEWTFKPTSARGRDSPVMPGPGRGMYARGHSPHMRYKQPLPPHHQQSQHQTRGSYQHKHQRHSTPSPQFGMPTMYDPMTGSPVHMMPPPQQQHGHSQHPQMYAGQYHSQPTFDQYGQPLVPYMPQHPGFPGQPQMQPMVSMGDGSQPMHSGASISSTASLGSMDGSGHGHPPTAHPQQLQPSQQQQKQTKFLSSVQVSILVPSEADAEAEAEAGDGEGAEAKTAKTVDEETNSVSTSAASQGEAEPDDKRTEQVVRDLFGKFGVVTGVTILKPRPSKSSPQKELVAVAHFEPSALGEQFALAAYTGLNGTACHMKSNDTVSTLALTRCMPKTRGKGRSSAKGQTQQAQQGGARPPPPQQQRLPPHSQAQQQQPGMHPGMVPMYGGSGIPQYAMDPRMQGGGSPIQGHPVDVNDAEDAMRRGLPLPGGMQRGMPMQQPMMQPGYSYPSVYIQGPNGPVPMVPAPGHMAYVPQDGGHPQPQYPPHFQHQYQQDPQQFPHQGEQEMHEVPEQPDMPLSSVLDAASAARHDQEEMDEAVLVHELEASLEISAAATEGGSQATPDEAEAAPAAQVSAQ